MKRTGNSVHLPPEKWKKIFMVMNFKLMILLGLVSNLAAAPSYSQAMRLSVKFEDQQIISVLEELKTLTSYEFFYQKGAIAAEIRISENFSDATLEQILDKVLKENGYRYSIEGEVVLINKAEPITASSRDKGDNQQTDTRKVSGKVSDVQGNPLPGVTITIKGLSVGVVTDANGKYTMTLPEDKDILLRFTFIGMKSQEVAYTGQDEINITLHEEAMQMDEVVVTGYQVIDKRKNTSSVTSKKMEDIMILGASSLDQMLEGHIPDMVLMTNSGEVGVAPKIRIRGTSTLIGNREPLWVVNGIIVQDPVPISAEELNDPDYVNRIGNAIAGINPQDIERVDVLKDAAATALYGVKAANGVIVVTTKKGRIGKPVINYNMNTTFRQRPRYTDRNINLMNSRERIQFSRELNEQHYVFKRGINYVGYEGLLRDLYDRKIDDTQFAEKVAKLESGNTDWFKLLTEDSWSHQHTISMSGGSEQTRYYASIGFSRDNDVIKNNHNQRYTASLNIESNLSKWLNASFQLSGNVSGREYSQDGIAPLNYAYNTSRAIPAYDEKGDYFFYEKRTNNNYYKYNVLNELENSYKQQNTSGITLTANLMFNFAPWLNANAIISYSNSNAEIEGYWGEKTNHVALLRDSEYGELPSIYSTLPYGGEMSHSETRSKTYTVRLQANANRYFGMDDQHNIALSAGFEMNSTEYTGYSRKDRGYYPDRGKIFVSGVDIKKHPAYGNWLASAENIPTLTENLTNLLSGYATLSYSYYNYFTANVNARVDGSNKFGDQSNDKLLPIWSASAAYNFSEHEALRRDWINYMSLKFSFGYQGNMLEDQSPVMIIKKLPMDTYHNEMAAEVSRNPNPNLKWEKTSSFNMGLTLAFLDNRIQIESEYYYKRTKDAFMTKEVASMNGVDSYVINGGDVENKGYNIDLTISPIKNETWRWTFSTSFSRNFNNIKNNPSAQTYSYNQFLNGTVIVKDKAINTFYSYDFVGLSPVDGGPMFNDMYNQKHELYGLDKYRTFTRVLKASGRREPYMSGGINTTLRYKQLRMSVMFAYALGAKTRLFQIFNKDFSPENNVHRAFLKRWKQAGDERHTNIPVLISKNTTEDYKYVSRHWSDGNSDVQTFATNYLNMYDYSNERVVSANYLKCSSLRFSYEFGEHFLSKSKLSRLELNVAGTNLFTICSKKLDGQTPTQGGFSEIQLSDRPTYTFGLSVSF